MEIRAQEQNVVDVIRTVSINGMDVCRLQRIWHGLARDQASSEPFERQPASALLTGSRQDRGDSPLALLDVRAIRLWSRLDFGSANPDDVNETTEFCDRFV